MALLQIRIEGDPILRKKARPVKEVTDSIRQLLDDMLETMYDDNGVGLAGPQVGKLRRLVTIDVGTGPYKLVNPEIIEESEEKQLDIEGCLSVPEFNGTVYRPKWVRFRYLDEHGQAQEKRVEGLFARCVCHEIDHLNGVLFRDKVDHVIDLEEPDEEMIAYLKDHHLLQQDAEDEDLLIAGLPHQAGDDVEPEEDGAFEASDVSSPDLSGSEKE